MANDGLMGPDFLDKLIRLAVDIQQIPAPTFAEGGRGDFIFQLFIAEGLADVHIDGVGNVYGCYSGASNTQPIVVTSHLDTVFPLDMELTVNRTPERIVGPGIGDNSLGVASLFGLIWLLKKQNRLKNDLWLVANVGEEGLGDLRGMKAVVDRFGSQPRAYLVLEGMALGSIYHRGLSVRRYRIQAQTQGGHSWVNFGRPSAIHELARFITDLEAVEIPTSPKTSYNVGTIQGGISVNTIAPQAELELDLRSESGSILNELANRVEQMAYAANQKEGPTVEFKVERIGDRPGGEIPEEHFLVSLAQSALVKLGISPRTDIGSTDANIPLSKGYPAVCVGITTGSGAHTPEEYIEIETIPKGMTQLLDLVKSVDRLR
jgi:tripeptide aminopeptidase